MSREQQELDHLTELPDQKEYYKVMDLLIDKLLEVKYQNSQKPLSTEELRTVSNAVSQSRDILQKEIAPSDIKENAKDIISLAERYQSEIYSGIKERATNATNPKTLRCKVDLDDYEKQTYVKPSLIR